MKTLRPRFPLSLTQQFALLSLLILVLGIVAVGWWVGRQIESGIINRAASAASLYVYSFLDDDLQELSKNSALSARAESVLERMVRQTPYGEQIVRFKVWGRGGVLVYTSNHTQIGQRFPIDEHQAEAWKGAVVSEITTLDKAENVNDNRRWDRLLETYTPVRIKGSNEVIAVVEFYQTVEALDLEVAQAKRNSWLVVAAILLAAYLLLNGLVRQGSNTIVRQQYALRDQVGQLNTLLAQNQELHQRVQGAATRTAALNERFLRRISAELHDGPAQLLSLALLRIDEIKEQVVALSPAGRTLTSKGPALETTLGQVESSLGQALKELREISSGLRLPELERLNLSQTIQRVTGAHELRSGTKVTLSLGELPLEAPLPLKITVYRLIEEALNNAFQHAGGVDQRVRVGQRGPELVVEVADHGSGFEPSESHNPGSLGLVGMRERVESLGGTIQIESIPGWGTTIRAFLPLQMQDHHE